MQVMLSRGNAMQLTLSESKAEAAMQKTINGTAVKTSFQDGLSYVTLLFSELTGGTY